MDQIKNRENFIKGFQEFLDLVENNKLDHFVSLVKQHKYFQHHSENIKGTDREKKIYIFTELTNSHGKKARESCNAIIEMLELSDLVNAAKKLREYNTSSGPIDILEASQDIEIDVLTTKIPNVGSGPYIMKRNPRGKFIIIDNVKNQIKNSCKKDVFIESDRFRNVFEQLFFEVEIKLDSTVKQMQQYLKSLKISEEDEAFGLMIISHGEKGKVLGINACKGIDANDKIETSEIVKLFSHLKQKPKFFIFDCCRVEEEKSLDELINLMKECNQKIKLLVGPNNQLTQVKRERAIDKNDNHNFIIYSCAEGYSSWLIPSVVSVAEFHPCISAFGQAFSHAIARYACEESLIDIMTRTCNLMDKFEKIIVDSKTEQTAYSAPDLHLQCAKRMLHFNPGFYEENRFSPREFATQNQRT